MADLREHQLRLLSLLKEFDHICSENGITWWLDSGSLLGAVRSHGFIPWDDDLDVCILGSDYPKIKKLLKANCPEPFFYDCSREGKTRLSPRFVDKSQTVQRKDPSGKGVKKEPLWIDTFVLREGSIKIKRLLDPLYGKCLRRIYRGIDDGITKRILAWIAIPFLWTAVQLALLSGKIFHKGVLLHDYGVPFYSVRRSEDIFPLGKIRFEDAEFPAPRDPDHYLTLIYGDYRKEPEEKDRVAHDIIL